MEKSTNLLIIQGIIAAVVILLLLNSFCIIGDCRAQEEEYSPGANSSELDEFAKYLTEQGYSMAGTDWCGHCANQKELFGDSFQYIDYHNCDNEPAWCSDQGVPGYPTWIFPDGSINPGTKSINQLKQISEYDG